MTLWVRRLRADELTQLKKLQIGAEVETFFSLDLEEASGGEDWGLWLDGELLGWCRIVGRPPILWVSRILIDAPYREVGYGRMLLGEILSEVGRTRRWQEVRAAVHPKNERALQFFIKQGFEPLPYAQEVGEVILKKKLR